MPHPLRNSLLVGLALALAVLAVYWPGLTGPFLFDDYPNIVTNPLIQISQLNWDSISRAAQGYVPGKLGRPVATVGFALDYLAWGKNPWGYKLHSVVIHAFNAVLVLFLARRLLTMAAAGWPGRHANAAALFVALLWAAHPLQVSTVLYVVQRMEMLAHTFVLLGLIAYLQGRIRQQAGKAGTGYLVLSGALAGVGLFAKESAALFPAYTLVLELTLLRFNGRNAAFRNRLVLAYGVGTVAAMAIFLLFILPAQLSPEAFAFRGFTLADRLLTQLRVLPMYLGQMVFPLPRYMLFYYDSIEPSRSLLQPIATLWGAILLSALLVTAWRLRHRAPLVSLGILWFFAAHAITSNILPLEMAFEHRNYFALLGVLLALADVTRRIPVKDTQTGKAIMVGLVSLLVVFFCVIRTATWGNELHLMTELVSNNPSSPRASSDLATLYIGMSDSHPQSPFYVWGIHEFERGSLLPNASPLPEYALIVSAATTGEPVLDQWWDRLMRKLETRPIGIQENLAVMGLVTSRAAGINIDDQRLSHAYNRLASRSQLPPASYAAMGDHAINVMGDEQRATNFFLQAISSSVNNPRYVRQIIETLTIEGHVKIAQKALDRASELGVRLDASAP